MTAMAQELRFAANLANVALVAVGGDGELHGRAIDIAQHVASCLARRGVLRRYDTAAAVLADAGRGWDIAFLAIDPARCDIVAFTKPYLAFEVGGAVSLHSPLAHVEQLDRPGMKIGCARGGYAAAVRRRIVDAELIDFAEPSEALGALEVGTVDCAIGLVEALVKAAADRQVRVLAGSIAKVEHALAVPMSHRHLLPDLEMALRSL